MCPKELREVGKSGWQGQASAGSLTSRGWEMLLTRLLLALLCATASVHIIYKYLLCKGPVQERITKGCF